MERVLVQLELAAGMPRPLHGRCPSLFGVWLRERIVSISLDWPAVGFHRIELLPDGVRLLLFTPRIGVPPDVTGLAVARAIRGEVQSAALAYCGLREGDAVWRETTVRMVEGDPTGNVAAA